MSNERTPTPTHAIEIAHDVPWGGTVYYVAPDGSRSILCRLQRGESVSLRTLTSREKVDALEEYIRQGLGGSLPSEVRLIRYCEGAVVGIGGAFGPAPEHAGGVSRETLPPPPFPRSTTAPVPTAERTDLPNERTPFCISGCSWSDLGRFRHHPMCRLVWQQDHPDTPEQARARATYPTAPTSSPAGVVQLTPATLHEPDPPGTHREYDPYDDTMVYRVPDALCGAVNQSCAVARSWDTVLGAQLDVPRTVLLRSERSPSPEAIQRGINVLGGGTPDLNIDQFGGQDFPHAPAASTLRRDLEDGYGDDRGKQRQRHPADPD